ncbi:hypothetical protein EYC08_18365 [Tabrizicola sp. WMC-M-20]|nr:hypothetical protein EYC08_18365 [Tabrizicola sp. WMC-M-20]
MPKAQVQWVLTLRIATRRFLTEGVGIMFRCCNSSTIALREVAIGEVDGHIGYGESVWDVMVMWPILTALGAVSPADWAQTELSAKLRFVIDKPAMVEVDQSLVAMSGNPQSLDPVP